MRTRNAQPWSNSLRRGLTLIELVVVMVILAAVAGIVLPMLPSLTTRAHTTTGATNVAEVAKAIQMHEGLYNSYPTNFDSITLTPGATGTLPTYLPGSTDLSATQIDEDMADALIEAGITSVRTMTASGPDWNPTFYPYGTTKALGPAFTDIEDEVYLATLTPAAAARLGLVNPTTTTYVVLGVGGYTSMQGKSLQDAPVHFADSNTDSPNLKYGRIGVVFQVNGTDASGATVAIERAQLTLIVAFHDDGLVGLNDHLAEYYAATQNDRN